MPLVMALGLPQSPFAAIVFILVTLAVVYALLTVLIRVQPPSRRALPVSDDDEEDEDDGTEPPEAGPPVVEAEPAPPAETPSPEPEPAPVVTPVQKVEAAVVLDAVRIRGVRVAVGDRAASVMRAVRRNEAGQLPLIDRDASGRAGHVTRHYIIEQRPVVIEFDRPEADGLLRLTAISVEGAPHPGPG